MTFPKEYEPTEKIEKCKEYNHHTVSYHKLEQPGKKNKQKTEEWIKSSE